MYGGLQELTNTLSDGTIGTKAHNFFRKVAMGEARKSRKFSGIQGTRIYLFLVVAKYLCKIKFMYETEIIMSEYVVPNEFHRSS